MKHEKVYSRFALRGVERDINVKYPLICVMFAAGTFSCLCTRLLICMRVVYIFMLIARIRKSICKL